LGRSQFLADTNTALAAVIVAAIWKGFPFAFLIYLAGLQNVDRSQVEAATMDGARFPRIVLSVIIPSMRPVIALTLLLTAIFTFNYFDMIWVMTKGGPLNSTHIFPTFIFQTGFGQFNFEMAAAYGVLAFALLLILLVPYLRHSLKSERDED
jgi:multiple sugar transport system permease protein